MQALRLNCRPSPHVSLIYSVPLFHVSISLICQQNLSNFSQIVIQPNFLLCIHCLWGINQQCGISSNIINSHSVVSAGLKLTFTSFGFQCQSYQSCD